MRSTGRNCARTSRTGTQGQGGRKRWRAVGGERLEPRSLLTAFVYTIVDPNGQLNQFPYLQTDINYIEQDLSRSIYGKGTIKEELLVDTTIPRLNATYTGGTWGTFNGITTFIPSTITIAQGGADPNGSGYDGLIRINPNFTATYYWMDPNPNARTNPGYAPPVPGNQSDFISVLEHETIHTLGFISDRATTGTQYGQEVAAQLPWDDVSSFVNGQLYFYGGHAQSVYGGPVPLTTVGPNDPTFSGSNFSHIGNPAGYAGYVASLANDDMFGGYTPLGVARPISALDKAMLIDMGWPSGPQYAQAATYNPNGIWTIVATDGTVLHVAWGGQPGDIAFAKDFNGDGAVDLGIYRLANGVGTWYIATGFDPLGVTSYYVGSWGVTGDVPVPADYNGVGHASLAVFRPSNSTWYIANPSWTTSSGNAPVTGYSLGWGEPYPVTPVPAVYDVGLNHAEVAFYAPSNGDWFIAKSWVIAPNGLSASVNSGYAVNWGGGDAVPAVGDYTGANHMDLAFYSPASGNWYIAPNWSEWANLAVGPADGASAFAIHFGGGNVIPVPADYIGNGYSDLSYYDPTNGGWYTATQWTYGTISSPGSFAAGYGFYFNAGGEKPVPGKYYLGDNGNPRSVNVVSYGNAYYPAPAARRSLPVIGPSGPAPIPPPPAIARSLPSPSGPLSLRKATPALGILQPPAKPVWSAS